MSESLSWKVKINLRNLGVLLCTIVAVAITMTGCGGDGATPAKYFRYEVEGNAKDGKNIVIKGLNTISDEKGNLKVNLENIWKKYQGKIVIPSKIDGLPVRKVSCSSIASDGGEEVPNSNGCQWRSC